ncbi:MAG: DUF3048 domain-containing protein [Bacillota bacterium]|nr:DUF3048 domain-containing protein [Bacillota bacterium]MDW7684650.1 DUF3048 domain-containing protein [Bacillota bacterium]
MKKWLSLALLLIIVAAAMIAGCNQKPPEAEPPPAEDPIEEPELEPEAESEPKTVRRVDPVTVVINNHAAARPQSGLQEATIVYEFLVEGGITRLLAVYDTLPEQDVTVGPVRSLRPYFAVQALEHGRTVAHSGYSQRTKEKISGLGIKEVTSATYLWRDNSRQAPHNLYTSMEKLYSARGTSDVTEETVTESTLPDVSEAGPAIEVAYKDHNLVSYSYDEEGELYLRFVNGKPHKDRETGQQYTAKRVILRQNKHTTVAGTDLVDISLEGSGDGVLYEGGRKYPIHWEKSGGKTRYTHTDGSPVDIRFYNTWIQVIR